MGVGGGWIMGECEAWFRCPFKLEKNFEKGPKLE